MNRMMLVVILLAGCRPQPGAEPDRTATAAKEGAGPAWSLSREPGETRLTLGGSGRSPAITLMCGAKDGRFTVNVPDFAPVGSEERLSFGVEGDVIALVANSQGDKQRGGVSGATIIPDELKKLITAPMFASYGAQQRGPITPPPNRLAGPFLDTCAQSLTAARDAAAKPTAQTHPCDIQDGQVLRHALKAIGTEPFWGAKIQGRCVTYSTPENQAGTRIWTKVETGPMGPAWVGALGGKPFVLRVQPAAGCSDGMSDRRYDWEARLTVMGEERSGCAETI